MTRKYIEHQTAAWTVISFIHTKNKGKNKLNYIFLTLNSVQQNAFGVASGSRYGQYLAVTEITAWLWKLQGELRNLCSVDEHYYFGQNKENENDGSWRKYRKKKETWTKIDDGKSEEETLLGNFKVYSKVIKENWFKIWDRLLCARVGCSCRLFWMR